MACIKPPRAGGTVTPPLLPELGRLAVMFAKPAVSTHRAVRETANVTYALNAATSSEARIDAATSKTQLERELRSLTNSLQKAIAESVSPRSRSDLRHALEVAETRASKRAREIAFLDQLGRISIAEAQKFVATFDVDHILAYELDVQAGRFSGGHHMPSPSNQIEMHSFTVDVKTGAAIVDMTIHIEGGQTRKSSIHTMFNPAWSRMRVLEEISTAASNILESETDASGTVKWVGKSASGTTIVGVTMPDGRIRTAYPRWKSIDASHKSRVRS